jgi:hypothetical protein
MVKTERDYENLKLRGPLVRRARAAASLRGMSLPQLVTELLEEPVNRIFREEAGREMEAAGATIPAAN